MSQVAAGIFHLIASQSLNIRAVHNDQDCFSLLHNNVRSPKRKLENLHVHPIHEFDSNFSVIGVTETKIAKAYSLNFNPNLPNYEFEYVPTPLSCGGVGIYFSSSLSYNVIEKTSTLAFQALWIEIQFLKKTNIICGVIYRQHNSPDQFQIYFDEILEKLSTQNNCLFMSLEISK